MNRMLTIGALGALLLAGCGGGGSSAIPHTTNATAPSTGYTSSACSVGKAICIEIPRHGKQFALASSSKHRDTISPATQSLVVNIGFQEFSQAGNPSSLVTNGPTAYTHTFNIATDCPAGSNGDPVCQISFISFPSPPSNATGQLWVGASAYDGPNASGNMLDRTLPPVSGSYSGGEVQQCQDIFIITTSASTSPNPDGSVETCTTILSGAVSQYVIAQPSPLVVGTATTMPFTAFAVDADGYVIADAAPPTTGYPVPFASCYTDAASDEISLGLIASSSSSLTMTTSSPANNAQQGCIQQLFYTFANATTPVSLSPSDTWALDYDGSSLPSPATITIPYTVTLPAIVNGTSSSSVLGTMTFTPLVVPADYVTIAGPTGAGQTLTVTPPGTYSGSVSLSVSNCDTPQEVFTVASPANQSNVSPSNLVTVSPASATSTNGSPVTFTISPTGTSGDYGTCTLTSSADGSTYGAVITWPTP